MLELFHGLRDMTLLSVTLRMLCAMLCGGIIGIEREYKRRPAGFRTHILICMGAAMTTLTSQYLLLERGYYTDLSRLGAQVIAGIGFIGAGTIVVTSHQRVKGLTTAAGLWTSAIVGLCLGAGFYEAGLLATVLILMAESLFSRLEYWILSRSPVINLFLEYTDGSCLDEVLRICRERSVKVMNLQITRHKRDERHNACAIFELRLNKKNKAEAMLHRFLEIPGVVSIEEL